jgi:hypothetical protein
MLRHPGRGPSAGVAPAAGQGGRNPQTERHMAARGRAGGGRAHAPGPGHAARRSHCAQVRHCIPASWPGRMGCQGRPPPAAGPRLSDARGRCFPPRLRGGSRRAPGDGGLAEAVQPVQADHASRQDGGAGGQEAAKSRPLGRGHGDLCLSRRSPLLGQDTPGIRGQQAQDGRETAAPVYASDLDRGACKPPCAMERAVSDAMCQTARLFPIVWDPWQFPAARSGLRADRAGVALRAEQTPPHGPHPLAEVCRFPTEETVATHTQDQAHHLAVPGTAQ